MVLRRYLNEVRLQHGDAIVVDQQPPRRSRVSDSAGQEMAGSLVDSAVPLQAFVHQAVNDQPAVHAG